MPLLSIIIPTYNDGKYLDEAIQSARETAVNDKEIIVVSDGTTDAYTLERLTFWESQKDIQVIRKENKGLAHTRNTGIAASKGKYILPLDADNRLLPDYGKLGVQHLESHPEDSVFYSDVYHFGDVSRIHRVFDFSLQRLLSYNFVDACAVYRRNVWEDILGYDENMPAMGIEDWDFWIRAALKAYRFHHHKEPLYEYRVRRDSMINQETAPKLKKLMAYLDIKYKGIFDSSFPSEYIYWRFQQNKPKFLFKLFLKDWFPSLYKKWLETNKIAGL
jgi:glycosyltransferase involved in cell wall biosynthesis